MTKKFNKEIYKTDNSIFSGEITIEDFSIIAIYLYMEKIYLYMVLIFQIYQAKFIKSLMVQKPLLAYQQ